MSRKLKWAVSVVVVVTLGLTATQLALIRHPQLQRAKNRILPFLILDDRYETPNTTHGEPPGPQVFAEAVDVRLTLHDRLETLILTTHYQLDTNSPGGFLIDSRFSRRGHLFGRYTSYDPNRLREHVAEIKQLAAERQKRILIFDEGEGGYVMRTGAQPAALDVGNFLFRGDIGTTMEGRVSESPRFEERRRQVRTLFDDFAFELVSRGVDVVLAPVLDGPDRDSVNPIRDERTFSTRHEEIEVVARIYIEAMRARGLLVVAKHFLTLSFVDDLDPHDQYIINSGSDEDFQAVFALYRRLSDELDGVMLSHLGNPRDAGIPSSISPVTVASLVDSVGFDGLIMTDELHMAGLMDFVRQMPLEGRQKEIAGHLTDPLFRAAILAFDAGVHQVLISQSWPMDDLLEEMETLYNRDDTFAARIDVALAKFARFREKRGN
ncbi:MAG: glycoside hydrolase family 3 N-terminal domain-containing protein [Rhodothermia bacterium]